jgi:cytochrome c oxidase assembly factor CtaG
LGLAEVEQVRGLEQTQRVAASQEQTVKARPNSDAGLRRDARHELPDSGLRGAPLHGEMPARELPGLVWLAGIIALGILVVLAVSVVHHLTTPAASGHSHSASTALFRAGAASSLGPLLSSRLVTEWQLNSVAIALVTVAAAWYVTALARLRRRRPEYPWRVGYAVSFFAGLAVCVYATCGAIAVYDQALFSAHMIGHLCLVMLAPALLVAGRPLRLAYEIASPSGRDRIDRFFSSPAVSLLTSPPVALACYTAVIVGSHLTGLMNTIMTVTWVGQVEHVVYLVVGYQFFALVVGDEPIRWRLATVARWAMLGISMAVDTFTGVTLMMTAAAVTMHPPASLAVDPLSDTNTGGAVMWFFGDAIMAVVMTALVISWVRSSGMSQRDTTSWLEQARSAALVERIGPVDSPSQADVDADDAQLAAYNAWLARLAEEPPNRRS